VSKSHFVPSTGIIREDDSEAKNVEVVKKGEMFADVFIQTPLHTRLMSRLDCLRLQGQANTKRCHRALRCLAAPSTGKTTVAERYRDRINNQVLLGDKRIPVLFISLENATTSRKLGVLILEALGDFDPTSGPESLLRRRIVRLLSEYKVEVIIIDEVHHLAVKRNIGEVINVLKTLLNQRLCPLAFLGTDAAEKLFTTNKELVQRVATVADINPLPNNADGRSILTRFLKELDRELQKLKIFNEGSDFVQDEVVAALMKVTGGVMALSTRVLQAALEIAIRRNASRIEIYDVSRAIDAWAMPQGLCKTNPLLEAKS
jgi:Bacterial TniB protein